MDGRSMASPRRRSLVQPVAMGHCERSHYAAAAASERGRAIAAKASKASSKASRDRLKDEQQHGSRQGQAQAQAEHEQAEPSLSPTGGTRIKGGTKGSGAVPWTATTVTRLSGAPSPSSKGYW
jgi:hypothetical protein